MKEIRINVTIRIPDIVVRAFNLLLSVMVYISALSMILSDIIIYLSFRNLDSKIPLIIVNIALLIVILSRFIVFHFYNSKKKSWEDRYISAELLAITAISFPHLSILLDKIIPRRNGEEIDKFDTFMNYTALFSVLFIVIIVVYLIFKGAIK